MVKLVELHFPVRYTIDTERRIVTAIRCIVWPGAVVAVIGIPPATCSCTCARRASTPCFELARRAVAALGPAVTVADEAQSFRYYDRRDLLGFVDGTANPTGPDAARAALVGPEAPRSPAAHT